MDRSPYAPPTAPLEGATRGPSTARPLAADTVDLGAAVGWPFQTPDWPRRCLVAGVVLLVPIAGFLAWCGWMRRMVDQVRSGEPGQVPEIAFGDDLAYGTRPFLAFTFTGLLFGLGMLGAYALGFGGLILVEQAAPEAAGGVALLLVTAMQLAQMAASLLFSAYSVELWRLGYRGHLLPPARLGESIRAVRAAPAPFLIAALGLFITNMLGSAGAVVCGIGILLSLPVGGAMAAHVVGQWDRVVATTQDEATTPA